jgi:site-specific DNA-cytosine methylase
MPGGKVQMRYRVAEWFCGWGGFDHGFRRTERFRVVCGNDNKKIALHPSELNHPRDGESPVFLHNDIRTTSDRQFLELLDSKGIENLNCLSAGSPISIQIVMSRQSARFFKRAALPGAAFGRP